MLFWSDISKLINKIKDLDKKYYPNDFKAWSSEKCKFIKQEIPTKKEFLQRLEYYEENGKPLWVASRNSSCDDLSFDTVKQSIIQSSSLKHGEFLAKERASTYSEFPDFWKFYVDNILFKKGNSILELTIGAGLGTSILMQGMSEDDLYMGVDIDFICAKHADALSKYHRVNGLGIATSLWNMPFEDKIFSSVCSNCGLDECREIPTIFEEATRVLKESGRMILTCRKKENSWYPHFREFGFNDDETEYWLKKVRLYSGADQIENWANTYGLKLLCKKENKLLGTILVFSKK